MNRHHYGEMIYQRLKSSRSDLRAQFHVPGRIASFVLDDVLNSKLAEEIYDAFPPSSRMRQKRSLKEYKHIAVQMNQYDSILEEIIYAFQEPRVLELISEITGIKNMHPDHNLYAGGLSLMAKGQFLNPHIDNSHDKDRKHYRSLNLLYYVSPAWREEYGGNLELWDDGFRGSPRVIHSKFNRLVCMATHKTSWHSVSSIIHEGRRCCVSNYYFSPGSLEGNPYFHPT